ncbi:hypothetical protein [Nocardia suismassiliense]|uniref:hypothetical protein n=1 Tax=Nocardia suismassiliense TaxID=2077092 RepID=UPI000D1F0F8C|nr:hypothetical protein [Nocardia suismassiliense]
MALRVLRGELENLASAAAAADCSRTPVGYELGRAGESLTVWYDANGLKIHTTDATVFVSTTLQFAQIWPDWCAMSRRTLREIAHAMLSAAAHVEDMADPGTSATIHRLPATAIRPSVGPRALRPAPPRRSRLRRVTSGLHREGGVV